MSRPKPNESERRLRHNFRLARLLRFLELISGPGRWSPKTLMKELEISERTLFRLRETLELAGVPLYFSKEDKAYRVRTDYRFPPLNLSDDEALGQASATSLSESEAVHLPSGSKATTRKLSATNSERVRTILDDVRRLTEVLDLKIADHPQQRETIRTVQSALLSRQMLSGTYRSPYETAPARLKLHPYRLALIKQAWYLIARPDGEEQPRTYRIVRFGSLKQNSLAATIPDDFDLKAYLGKAWSVFRGNTTYDVELLFGRDVADIVLETTWHHTQKVTKHANGSVTLRFQVDGLEEIVRWIVAWAGKVKVIKPAVLVAKVLFLHRHAFQVNSQRSPKGARENGGVPEPGSEG